MSSSSFGARSPSRGVSDLGEGLELGEPAGRRLVEPRVLDRDGSLRCQELNDLLVLLGEVLAAGFLREVQVPVGHSSEEDRHAEKRPHRRMVRRKPDRGRCGVRAEIGEPERLRLTNQHASIPRPRGGGPIASTVARSRPVTTNFSYSLAGSITPSAAPAAPVSSATAWTIRWRTASIDSSDDTAIGVEKGSQATVLGLLHAGIVSRRARARRYRRILANAR